MNKIVHYLGLDVHKDSIAVSIAPQHSTEVRRYGIIGGTLDAVDKLIKRLSQPGVELRIVYEAGPCGFVLCRHLRSKDIHCDVVSPSLIPKKASDRVKTDRRDADQLARLYRGGELTAIHAITKCGNAHCRRVLTEAAWHYRLKPLVSEAMWQPFYFVNVVQACACTGSLRL